MLGSDAGQTRSDAVLGTPAYMAPEQAAGDSRHVGPAADVYALGAVLYECLTGRPPFAGPGVLDVLEQVRSADPVPPRRLVPRCPRDLETICLKCLRKQPGARYASAADLADDLHRFLAGEPVKARPVSAVVRGARWATRKPFLAGALAVAATAVLAAIGLWAGFTARLDVAYRDAITQKQAAEEEHRQAEAARQAAEAARNLADAQRERAEQLLGRCVTAVERSARAAVQAREAKQIEPNQPGVIVFTVAAEFAVLAAELRADAAVPPADRDRLANRYEADAVGLLEQAREHRYFHGPEGRKRLNDPRLASLRRTDVYRAWAKKLSDTELTD